MLKTKIVVIEDEPPLLNNILQLLQAEDFEAIGAENGRVGVQLVMEHHPALILCDIRMPELDGYGVLNELRQNQDTAKIPLIFISALADKTDLRYGMELGADDYLTKPFTRAELLGAIAARLTRQAALSPSKIDGRSHPIYELNYTETSLHQALTRGEFILYYQPQVDLKGDRITGAEALLRWQHPEYGFISPADFIPWAEETGFIIPIGEWVLRTACTQCKNWQLAGFPPLRIAVNLSAHQLNQPNIKSTIVQILEETGLKPHYLELELTESIMVKHPETAIHILGDLRKLGIHVSIDDFGTGYAFLNYLKQFTFDTIKIDRCFVHNINNDLKNAAISKAIISMAHSLNLRVIAEGVETQEERDFLLHNQCDGMQGYLFSRPLPAEEFTKLQQNSVEF